MVINKFLNFPLLYKPKKKFVKLHYFRTNFLPMITGQPSMLEAFMCVHPFFFLFDQQFSNKIFALFTDIHKGFLIEDPTTSLDIFQCIQIS